MIAVLRACARLCTLSVVPRENRLIVAEFIHCGEADRTDRFAVLHIDFAFFAVIRFIPIEHVAVLRCRKICGIGSVFDRNVRLGKLGQRQRIVLRRTVAVYDRADAHSRSGTRSRARVFTGRVHTVTNVDFGIFLRRNRDHYLSRRYAVKTVIECPTLVARSVLVIKNDRFYIARSVAHGQFADTLLAYEIERINLSTPPHHFQCNVCIDLTGNPAGNILAERYALAVRPIRTNRRRLGRMHFKIARKITDHMVCKLNDDRRLLRHASRERELIHGGIGGRARKRERRSIAVASEVTHSRDPFSVYGHALDRAEFFERVQADVPLTRRKCFISLKFADCFPDVDGIFSVHRLCGNFCSTVFAELIRLRNGIVLVQRRLRIACRGISVQRKLAPIFFVQIFHIGR